MSSLVTSAKVKNFGQYDFRIDFWRHGEDRHHSPHAHLYSGSHKVLTISLDSPFKILNVSYEVLPSVRRNVTAYVSDNVLYLHYLWDVCQQTSTYSSEYAGFDDERLNSLRNRARAVSFIMAERLVGQAWTGLFWFTDDYSSVVDICEEQEFDWNAVRGGQTIEPRRQHYEVMDRPSDRPRGRVSVIKGEVRINVGLKCPDAAVGKVKEVFGLRPFGNYLRVNRGLHWDKK